MSPLPDYRPRQLSLGPLETEILNIVWELGCATVKEVHERILSDPDRELAYTSVTTVLNRLTNKGWLSCYKKGRVFYWEPLVSREEARAIKSYEQLHQFLAVSNPDIVASFADSLDTASLEQLEAIASRLEKIRRQREEQK
ncbi:MAG: BlaI/MecI/CopY family transcriptional regulator [Hydrococcus sp. C42_A2020_068]|uniref:CopY family transcriptional regulator n=1 Tax=Hydrococcus rivularis NIES-593 TaxID=1921803 RepID=A0A1U7HF77_9CYAN|nr:MULTISPECIES: BlaI/MecI/CopY family transcriptional regulator [Pleurocapsales]AFY78643.1 putative transcriptional regulator [Pleurocapsa sp. PCC 7327]MBF2018650.1 BlaI/MecI/CopY family transcriptional regulator [Hydrococcus sp. C42_A2020_068]OKH22214.1 CopY family transcriptional regulator [Hydrococcus rivularis NIES-593]